MDWAAQRAKAARGDTSTDASSSDSPSPDAPPPSDDGEHPHRRHRDSGEPGEHHEHRKAERKREEAHEEKPEPTPWYAVVGLGSFRLTASNPNFDGNGHSLSVSGSSFGGFGGFGYEFNKSFAGELRVGTASSQSNQLDALNFGSPVSSPFNASFDTNSFVSLLLKGSVPINDDLAAYVIGGYTHFSADLSATILGNANSVGSSDNDFSIGAGVEGKISEDVSVGVEYIRYLDTTNGNNQKDTVDGTVGTVKFHF